jgi:transcriptional regulator
VADQVPTWNYVAVHLRGRLRALPQEDLHGVLERLSAGMEARLLPKKPWTMEKMSDGVAAKMMRMIAPIAMDVRAIDGTWKLGQNKDEAARLGGADGITSANLGVETDVLAALMKEPPC